MIAKGTIIYRCELCSLPIFKTNGDYGEARIITAEILEPYDDMAPELELHSLLICKRH
jgi:hypothetical protein